METIKTIKGFDNDLKCRGYQYEVGKEYDHDGEVVMCDSGFHAINTEVSPLKVFDFYPPVTDMKPSRYCKVEVSGDLKKKEDKVVGSHIKIGGEIGITGLVKAHIEWVKSHVTNEYNADKGKPVCVGEREAATAGDIGAATAGDSGAATAGDSGAATSRGSIAVGENGVATVRGNDVKAKGGMGAVLTIAEENETDCNIKYFKTFIIDGETYKADTWYKLNKKGAIVECEE